MSIFDPELVNKHAVNASLVKQSTRYPANEKVESEQQLDDIIENLLMYILYRAKLGIHNNIFESENVKIPFEIFGATTDEFPWTDKARETLRRHPNILYVKKELEGLGFDVEIDDKNDQLIISWNAETGVNFEKVFAKTMTSSRHRVSIQFNQ